MKIMIVHTRYQEPGGEDVAVSTVQKVLSAAGHEVTTFLFNNVSHAAAKLLTSAYNPLSASRIAAEVMRFRPDVIHIHNTWFGGSPSIIRTLSGSSIPVVATLHNFRPLCINGALFRDGAPCVECLETPYLPGLRHGCFRSYSASVPATLTQFATKRATRLSRWLDHAFALSEFSRGVYIDNGWMPDNISVINNAVIATDGKIASPATSQTLLFVGRDSPEKGLQTLLRAWPSFVESTPTASLRLAGVDRCDIPGVVALGRLGANEVRAEMASARALVVPSACFENQPMVIVEAMSTGLPVIVSAHGSLPELLVSPEGPVGISALPNDSDDWAVQMRSLWRLDMEAMGNAAKLKYGREHSPTAVAARLIAAYEKVLSQKRLSGLMHGAEPNRRSDPDGPET